MTNESLASEPVSTIDEESAASLTERLTEFYEGLSDGEKALMSGVIWRSLPPVERVQFSETAEGFSDLELQLLEELER